MTDSIGQHAINHRAGAGSQWIFALIATAAIATVSTDYRLFLLLLSAGLVSVALVKFDWFVYALVFFLPWYPLLQFDPPFRDVSLLSRFLLLAGVAVVRHREGKTLHDWFLGSRLKKGVLLFALVATVSVFLSELPRSTDGYRSFVRLLSYLMVFFAISGWIVNRAQVITILKLLLASTIGAALFGIYQGIDGSYTDFYFYLYPIQEESMPPWSGRVPSILFHFNSLAGYLNLILPFAIACTVAAKERALRVLGFLCHATAAAALYLTGSRGGAIAYCAALMVVLWIARPNRAALAKLALSFILAAVVVLPVQPSDEGARLQTVNVDESTQQSRLVLWGVAATMFLEHPVLGVGYGGYRLLYNNQLGWEGPDKLDAHNMYLQFLAETGIVGFIVFFLLMAGFVRLIVRVARQPDPLTSIVGLGAAGALLTVFTHGMVDYLFNSSPQFGGLFWLILALPLAMWALPDERRDASPDSPWETPSPAVQDLQRSFSGTL